MNLFDQLYEVPDEDEHLEPIFDVDPSIYWEIDLHYAQGEM
jgi:hypothetical protein